MTGEENLSYPSTEQVVNKINYTHPEKVCLISDTNSTLSNNYDESI